MDIDTIYDMEKNKDVEGLIQSLDAGEDFMTEAAVKALGRLADPCAVDALIRLLGLSKYYAEYGRSLKKGTGQYQSSVMDALVSIGSPAVPKLLDDFQKNLSTRGLVAQVLGLIGDPKAVSILTDYLNGELGTVYDSYEVTKALCDIGHTSCVETLVKILTEEKTLGSKLGFEIIQGLQKSGWQPQNELQQVFYYVMKGQYDRCAAMGSAAVPYLIIALEKATASEEMRVGIIQALGEIRDELAVNTLIEQRNKESYHPQVIDAINDALIKIGKRIL